MRAYLRVAPRPVVPDSQRVRTVVVSVSISLIEIRNRSKSNSGRVETEEAVRKGPFYSSKRGGVSRLR